MILFIIMIAIILGIIMGLYLKISIASFLFIFISIIYIGFSRMFKVKEIDENIKIIFSKKTILIFIICLVLSYIQIQFCEKSFDSRYQDVQDEIKVVGTIISNGVEEEYKTRYVLKIESINDNYSYKGTKLLLNIKKKEENKNQDKNEIQKKIKNKNLKYGDEISFIGDFDFPEVQRNYKGFDYKFYLKTQKIYGIVNTKFSDIKIIKNDNANIISLLANKVANKIETQSERLLNEEKSSLLTGILIGKKDKIDDNVQENFRDSNMTHMLAVSGSHISYILLALGFTIEKTKIHKRFSKILIIILLFFFMLITGKTASVMRASIMSIYLIIGNFCYKKISILASLSFSMIVILLINPYSIFDIGLQLSYGGTIGIIYLYPKIKRWVMLKRGSKKQNNNGDKKQNVITKIYINIEDMIFVTISANIIIIPIMILNFNTISLTFIISNLLATPIMGIIVILGFITIISSIVLFPISQILSKILSIFLYLFSEIANICANIPFSKIIIPTPNIIFVLLYYFFILYIVLNDNLKTNIKNILKKINKKVIIILMIVIIIFIPIKRNIFDNSLKIFFIDVGQGDSMCIVTPKKKTILIDGGGNRDRDSFDVGKQILLPYLLDRNITKIDYCIITHFDSDHVGGLFCILENLNIKNVIISKQGEDSENYREFKNIVKKKKIKVIVVKKGDSIQIEDNIKIDILWPKEDLIEENILNNNSIVAKFYYNQFSMLLTGDIEQIAEEEILKECEKSNILKSTILKVAHHGSKSSTIKTFLDKVKPKMALIGVGKDNTFGHPNKGVIDRLESLNVKIYRTDMMGEIEMNINKKGKIKVKTKI